MTRHNDQFNESMDRAYNVANRVIGYNEEPTYHAEPRQHDYVDQVEYDNERAVEYTIYDDTLIGSDQVKKRTDIP